MSFKKILLSCASLSLLASCDPRVFDDLSDSTWVHSGGKPGDLTSAGYGSGLIGGSDGTGDLRYFVAAENPPAIVLVSFDKAGSRAFQEPVLLPGNAQFPVPTIMASDPDGFDVANANAEANGNAVVAVVDTGSPPVPALAMLRPDSSAPIVNIPLAGLLSASGVAFGATDATPEIDLLAAGGLDLNLINDYKNYTAGDSVPTCSLGGQAGGLILADVDTAVGSEYLVGVGNSVSVGQASQISVSSGCTFLGTITAPGGEASFGRTLQSGDFDGNGAADLVIAAPDENAVYVFMNWTTLAIPSMGTKIPSPAGSTAFGVNLAVGDFDGDGSDELVISDHAREADGVTAAGTVYIYSQSAGFAEPIELHDAQPQSDQVFGKSLTVAKAFGGDTLVVGAKNEVFTYFRTPVAGDTDSRE